MRCFPFFSLRPHTPERKLAEGSLRISHFGAVVIVLEAPSPSLEGGVLQSGVDNAAVI